MNLVRLTSTFVNVAWPSAWYTKYILKNSRRQIAAEKISRAGFLFSSLSNL